MSIQATVGHQASAATGPTQINERIQTVDIVRGFALLGIGMVNLANFGSAIFLVAVDSHAPLAPIDQLASWLITFFAEGKFYPLFSFLFGLGLAIQMERAAARGTPFVPIYARRLLVLLLIGLAHATLVWSGDILVLYAVLGFLLLLFRKRSPRALLIWAGISMSIPILLSLALYGLVELGRGTPENAAMIDESFRNTEAMFQASIAQADQVYANGTFAEATAQRLRDLSFLYSSMPFFAPNVFAMFLLGLYAGERGIFQNVAGNLAFIRRVRGWGLAIGLLLSAIYVVADAYSSRALPSLPGVFVTIAFALGGASLCFGYAATIALLAERNAWQRRLAPLAAAGRMALTNYITHSLVGALLFYGYGLGLYGRIGVGVGALIVLALYGAQLVFSTWWLRRFNFGPLEWLWRSLSYGRWQPLRRASTPTLLTS